MRRCLITSRLSPQITQITQNEKELATKRHKKHKRDSTHLPLCLLCLFVAYSYLCNLRNLWMLFSCCPPLHMLVRAKLFDDDKTKPLVKTVRIVIEHKDHVTQRLACAS